MFTGIIERLGRVSAVDPGSQDARLHVTAGADFAARLAPGDSIAVNGVCLTVVESADVGFAVDVSAETLVRSTVADLQVGDEVNLERPLTLGTPLSGHLVAGHVDGVGAVTAREKDGRSVRLTIQAPEALARYIAVKGSISVDGVSLTVNAAPDHSFEVNVIPHTLEVTTIKDYRVGTRVNLEVDLIARYLERLARREPL